MASVCEPSAKKQAIPREFLDELTYKILSIVRRKANEGDASARAIIEEAMSR